MVNIMIVDDEERIRLGLAKLVKQAGEEYVVQGIFSNGQEMIDNLESFPVDLIITDIRMPQMGGLEMIEKVQSLRPGVKFAIVSGFNDFTFARQAIRLGVEEYLLKPVETSELHQLLERVKEKLLQEGSNPSSSIEDDLRLLANNDVERLPELLKNEAYQQLERTSLFKHRFCIFVIHANSELVQDRIRGVVSNWGRENTVLSWEVGEIVVVTEIRSEDEQETARQLGLELLHAMPANVPTRIGVSGLFTHPTWIRQAYISAHEALQLAWYEMGIRHLIDATQLPMQQEEFGQLHRIIDREFRSAMRMLDFEKADEAIHKWTAEVTSQRPLWHHLRESCTLVQVLIRHEKLERNIASADHKEDQKDWLPHFYSDWQSFVRDFMKWVQAQFNQLKDLQQENREVETVKSFIHEHYIEEMELSKLAEIVFLTPSYLSKLFRTKTGATITDYIISVRIEKAKEWLREDHGLKTYEVGQKVGYSDPAYFNKVFKKMVGVTPKEYRDRVRS